MTSKHSFLAEDGTFVIEGYNTAKPFASFFPGIAGPHGIPMWTFYVNRGQCICSMGLRDKEQPIMEFLSANRAYQITSNQGFRTFVKVTRGETTEYYEPFQQQVVNIGMDRVQRMLISSSELQLEERNETLGLVFRVTYFNVPEDTYGGLVRTLEIENIGRGNVKVEVLDGLPLIIPYGVDNFNLKNMRFLVESFVEVANYENGVPFFKGKVKQEDKPEVVKIKRGNFYAGFLAANGSAKAVKTVIDPKAVFGDLTDYAYPEVFMAETPYSIPRGQRTENSLPCAMGSFKAAVKKGGAVTYHSIIGNCGNVDVLQALVPRIMDPAYVEARRNENRRVVEEVAQHHFVSSAISEFDQYCQQNFLDNVLRGGLPVTFPSPEGERTAFHIYSRKHGDLERDYNMYVLSPTNYSQGNGNYRDINQNRRCDLLVNPDIGADNVEHFYNLLQLDGFNPLGVGATAFKVTDQKRAEALIDDVFAAKHRDRVREMIAGPFQPGELFAGLQAEEIKLKGDPDVFLGKLLASCEKHQETDYGHCYWSDHWHYNLDLLENYLAVYPENLREILLENRNFSFFDNPHRVVPREDKYVLWEGRPMQLGAVQVDEKKAERIEARTDHEYGARTKYGKGKVYRTTLANKLLCLVLNKFASLDPEGVGVEMESDKPNWYDALNGLPGLLGSSLSETLELKRHILFMLDAFDELGLRDTEEWVAAEEIVDFYTQLRKALKKHFASRSRQRDFLFWDEASAIKEAYRERVHSGVSGREVSIRLGDLRAFLKDAVKKIDRGIDKAWDDDRKVLHTYFRSVVDDYELLKEKTRGGKSRQKVNARGMPCFRPTKMTHHKLPLFLEGPVHYLRCETDAAKRADLAAGVRASGLFDRKLKMYKVNDDLTSEPMEIGRSRTFSRGWLENESIWLHMEYKYMLELLRGGLYDSFFKDFKNVFVPFMDPAVYGRCILENSSFIASSANPNKAIHGNGFVARLSGSTAEFVHILSLMTLGERPFTVTGEGELQLKFEPVLPKWLFTDREQKAQIWRDGKQETWVTPAKAFTCTFLGDVRLMYRNTRKGDTFGPKAVKPQSITLINDRQGKTIEVQGDTVSGPLAEMIRDRQFNRIEVELK
jgi:hypothetical protein